MILETAAIMAIAKQCATGVDPRTIAAVVQTESSGNILAIGVNGTANPPTPDTPFEAARVARAYIDAGYTVDLGLGQINSKNLEWLGLSLETVFEPCRNVRAAAAVLSHNYASARRSHEPQAALRVALSMYNTGDSRRGFCNGYVAKVERQGRRIGGAPVIPASSGPPAVSEPNRDTVELADAQPPAAPAWDVFAQGTGSIFVFGRPTYD